MSRGRYPHMLQQQLNRAFVKFGAWKKLNKVISTQARFTCSRVNRHSRQDFPCLSSKGIAGKRLSYWLADEAKTFATRNGRTELDELVATTALAYRRFLTLLDQSPLVLTEGQANEIFRSGHMHLLTYARLRKRSAGVTGAHAGNRALWQLAPKHHYMLHVLHEVRSSRVNCRYYSLLAGESFVGAISRVARMCHRGNLSQRVIQKYNTMLSMDLFKRFNKHVRAFLRKHVRPDCVGGWGVTTTGRSFVEPCWGLSF